MKGKIIFVKTMFDNNKRSLNIKMMLLIISFSVISAAIVILATPHGASTSPDGINYLAASRSLVRGDGYLRMSGEPLLRWPPLYPTILAGVGLFSEALNESILTAVSMLNAVTQAALMVVSGMLLMRLLPARYLAVGVGMALLLVGYPLLLVSFFSYSEPIFNLLVMVFLLILVSRDSAQSMSQITLLGVIAALASLQRYAGVTLLPVGVIVIWLRYRTPLRQKFYRVGWFVMVAALSLALWFLNNYRLTGSLRSGHIDSGKTLGLQPSFSVVYQVMIRWLLPDDGLGVPAPGYFRLGAAIGLMILVMLLLTYVRHRKINSQLMLTSIGWRLEHGVLAGFLVTYSGFIVALNTSATETTIDDRMMSPAYAPFVVLVILLWNTWSEKLIMRWDLAGFRLIAVLPFVVWLSLITPRFVNAFTDFSQASYNMDEQSTLVQSFAEDNSNTSVVSNNPRLVLEYGWRWADAVPSTINGWDAAVHSKQPLTLIWFSGESHCEASGVRRGFCVQTNYHPYDLIPLFEMSLEMHTEHGSIYTMIPYQNSDP